MMLIRIVKDVIGRHLHPADNNLTRLFSPELRWLRAQTITYGLIRSCLPRGAASPKRKYKSSYLLSEYFLWRLRMSVLQKND